MMASSIRIVEQGLLRKVWNAARKAVQWISGNRVEKSRATSPAKRDRLSNEIIQDGYADDLTSDLFARRIDHQQWTLEARQRIKDTFIAQYLLGKGGRANMTQADWGGVGNMLRKQYEYLQRFEQDLIDGKVSEAQARVRLRMYIQASTQAHERGYAEMLGLPRMPAQPGDGSTVCKAQCKCHWEYEETDDEWLATWTLGAAEHCPDCLERAATWNPYRIQK